MEIYSPNENLSCLRFDPDAGAEAPEPVYYGRSPVVSLAGAHPSIPLIVECSDTPAPEPPLCGEPDPEPGPLAITTTVTNLETLSPLAATLHGGLDLSFGGLEVTTPLSPALFLRYAGLIYYIPGASWFATLETAPDIVGCPATRVVEPDDLPTVISCEAEGSPEEEEMATVGYYVDLADLPAVANIYDTVAADGVVVGRVIDAAGSPVSGAMVSVQGADAAIYYLSADRTTLSDVTGTAAHGYFVVLAFDGDACCHTLAAETADTPPLSGTSLAPVALVQDAVTAVLVRVQ